VHVILCRVDGENEKKPIQEQPASQKAAQTTVSADLWKKIQIILSQAGPVRYVSKVRMCRCSCDIRHTRRISWKHPDSMSESMRKLIC